MSTRVPVTERFRRTVAERHEHVAFRSRALQDPADGTSPPGWGSLSWVQYGSLVDQLSAALIGWGITPGDRVAILSGNRWEWQVADMAVLMAGAMSVPIYPTSSPQQVAYIVGHSGARACLVEDLDQLAKVLAAAASDPTMSLEHLLLFGSEPYEGDAGRLTVHAWDTTLAAGADALLTDPGMVAARSSRIAADDLATIVYTSGTTGPPKGVLLSHANIDATVEMITSVVPIGPDDRFLSFLPLSHIAERVVSHFGHLASGGETWFARSISTLSEDLQDCRPTIMFAVPRVWEKAKAALDLEIHRSHGIQRWLLDRYRSLALHHLDAGAGAPEGSTHQEGSTLHDVAERFAALELAALDRVVGHKIRHGMGLDRARALFSGAAPIDPALLRWLVGAGLHVGEVYGQTEVTGPTTISPPGRFRIGMVGPAMPGVEVRIAPDGEVLVRGANVCRGYYRNEEATAALIDADGWMHSGDLGELDADGYLRITGRKKDLMKTAGGKYIAPQELELRLRSCRFIANAVVVAEGRPYVTALLTLDAEAIGPWAEHHGKPISLEALASDPDVLAEVAAQVAEVNRAVSHAEEVKRWHVLPRDLTLDAGEMTPTLKVVRPVVLDHFKDAVDQLYAR